MIIPCMSDIGMHFVRVELCRPLRCEGYGMFFEHVSRGGGPSPQRPDVETWELQYGTVERTGQSKKLASGDWA